MGRAGERGAVSTRGQLAIALAGIAAALLAGAGYLAHVWGKAQERSACEDADTDFLLARVKGDRDEAGRKLRYLEQNCPGADVAAKRREFDKPPPPSTAEQLAAATSLAEAIQVVRGDMGASAEWDGATVNLARYAREQLTETNITALTSTTFGLAQKDPDDSIGKSMCVSGEVIQIHADSVGEPLAKVYRGGIMSDESSDVIQFLTPWGTGDIVKGSAARYCGVFTGLYRYVSTTGEQVVAAKLVGVFQLKKATK